MKTLREMGETLERRGLLAFADTGRWREDPREIYWVAYDSKRVVPGTLFFCKGKNFRPEYLREAAHRGCAGYVSEKRYAEGEGVPCLLVRDIREAMAALAAVFFEYRPGSPRLTGITGTKGKTTTAWYLKAMFDEWEKEKEGKETGMLSSVENYDGMRRETSSLTTPEALALQEHLFNARAAGLSHVALEVSSQALKYGRVKELVFDVSIFLNISEDHISPGEHRDFQDYFTSKLSIFRQSETACVNLDADQSDSILKAARKAGRIVTFGSGPGADLRCRHISREKGRITFQAVCRDFKETFELGMKGIFNIENAMGAIAAGWVYGIPVSCMKRALLKTQVPGRMETLLSRDKKVCGIVDYAHNRLSFERLYEAVYQEYPQYRKIITVFGCPGGKALNRRKELGLLAGLCSDKVYITSDDPDRESQEAIAGEIAFYVKLAGCPCRKLADRQAAVREAVKEAQGEKTLVLILGKGCENRQKLGGKTKLCPRDMEYLREAFALRENRR